MRRETRPGGPRGHSQPRPRAGKVPVHEIEFRTSHSSGPGGQNVNKLETRVEARWKLRESGAITPEERARLEAILGARIGPRGILRVTSQRYRSQSRNKEAALARLQEIVAEALTPRKERHATAPTQKSEESRIAQKKRRSRIKRLRALKDEEAGG
ncbi:MAG: aminoacyl-tRNA hydrolase [Candidatus Eisenbacteria bacterium]|uniref:Aminoacyl-tRNA hydrolase n=1 Tax=Eiseniibacteriota bacterium TaxID=2212470 RepID=A0A538T473_UNCEI|nr:MAG: aminoacyl-tRNA hydrolase [Candidatus Eisenbacteria bacterium]